MDEIKSTYEHMQDLLDLMGPIEYALWVASFEPPLDARSDAEIRRIFVSKLIEVSA